MTLIKFVRLILDHLKVLIIAPLLVMLIIYIVFDDSNNKYLTSSKVYTGFASGYSINNNESKDYFTIKNKFSNFFENVKSRSTREEIILKTLAFYISKNKISEKDMMLNNQVILFDIFNESLVKKLAVKGDSSKTFKNLKTYYNQDFNNEVYHILNSEESGLKSFFSLDKLLTIKVNQQGTSDLVKINYTTNDPGVTYNTVKIAVNVILKQVKSVKFEETGNVVAFFLNESNKAKIKLDEVEYKLNKLLTENNVINYYEQTKFLAQRSEGFETRFEDEKLKLEGAKAKEKEASIKMSIGEGVILKTTNVVRIRDEIKSLNNKISFIEIKNENIDNKKNDTLNKKRLKILQKNLLSLRNELETEINNLYSMQSTATGIKLKDIALKWIDAVINVEESSAKVKQYYIFKKEFAKRYSNFSELGSKIKQFERKIAVLEKRYLDLLSSLNDAKLIQQNIETSSDLKIIDKPFYPVNAIKSKKKLIILAGGILALLIVLTIIILMEFFDKTLKNIDNTKEQLDIPSLGMIAKVTNKKNRNILNSTQDRLIELIMQNLNHSLKSSTSGKPKVINVISTQKSEGKTVVARNIYNKLIKSGKSVLLLNYKDKIQENFKNEDFNKSIISIDIKDSENHNYQINKNFYNSESYNDLTTINNNEYDYVIIELPNIIEVNYPIKLVMNSDITILVCRSNRLWTKADNNLLNNIKELLNDKLYFIINGVEANEVETVLGSLGKKPSKLNRFVKNLLRLQFYSESEI
jgi:polysaccharide biosynthesis transport protein